LVRHSHAGRGARGVVLLTSHSGLRSETKPVRARQVSSSRARPHHE
jgi:hypothetical protein